MTHLSAGINKKTTKTYSKAKVHIRQTMMILLPMKKDDNSEPSHNIKDFQFKSKSASATPERTEDKPFRIKRSIDLRIDIPKKILSLTARKGDYNEIADKKTSMLLLPAATPTDTLSFGLLPTDLSENLNQGIKELDI
jgi:hypothetical protein